MEIALSYIVTTFNKLQYLSVTLPLLIEACGQDEEIVVVDGGSTDGTAEYLGRLAVEKKIHYFISERDHGEAHGTNKAILASRGKLLKIITDDDVFDFKLIKKCRAFMESHPFTDIMGFDGYGCSIAGEAKFIGSNYIKGFRKWLTQRTPFVFCGLSFLIRKSSISYMGLLSTEFKIVDMEYSIRISALKTNICFCTGMGFVNIVNPDSNSQKFYTTIRSEQKKLAKIYPSISHHFDINSLLIRIKDSLSGLRPKKPGASPDLLSKYSSVVKESMLELERSNRQPPQFLTTDETLT